MTILLPIGAFLAFFSAVVAGLWFLRRASAQALPATQRMLLSLAPGASPPQLPEIPVELDEGFTLAVLDCAQLADRLRQEAFPGPLWADCLSAVADFLNDLKLATTAREPEANEVVQVVRDKLLGEVRAAFAMARRQLQEGDLEGATTLFYRLPGPIKIWHERVINPLPTLTAKQLTELVILEESHPEGALFPDRLLT